jgi:hypothetical protein
VPASGEAGYRDRSEYCWEKNAAPAGYWVYSKPYLFIWGKYTQSAEEVEKNKMIEEVNRRRQTPRDKCIGKCLSDKCHYMFPTYTQKVTCRSQCESACAGY